MAATHTPRLNLNMPNESDFVNVITDINENMQNIDDAFGMIGSQYDPTAMYQKDDYCMHEAKVYRALQDIDTPEEWDETHWTESDITDEIKRTANSISTTASTIREEVRNFENELDIVIVGNTASVNVTAGQYVTVRDSTITGITDGIYKATENVAAGTAFVAANLSAVTSGALNDLSGNLADKQTKLIRKTATVTFATNGIGYLDETYTNLVVSASVSAYPCMVGFYNNKWFLLLTDIVNGQIVPKSGTSLVQYWTVQS